MTYKPQINSKQPFARPTGYRPVVTNYRQDYSSIRNTNWISHHQYADTHHRKVDDGTAKAMVGLGVFFLLMLIVAVAM